MSLVHLYLLFPAILAIHNAEEYSRYDEFVHAYHSRLPQKFLTRPIVRDAAIFLTLTVALLDALTCIYGTATLMNTAMVSVFALMFNGLGHCFLSFKQRTLTPGTLSAVTLVLPYSALAVAALRTSSGASLWSLFRYAALGIAVGPLTILFFFAASFGLRQIGTAAGQRESVKRIPCSHD